METVDGRSDKEDASAKHDVQTKTAAKDKKKEMPQTVLREEREKASCKVSS